MLWFASASGSHTPPFEVRWLLPIYRRALQITERSDAAWDHSYDNALAATINGLYKAELIHRRGRCPVIRSRRICNTGMGRLVPQ